MSSALHAAFTAWLATSRPSPALKPSRAPAPAPAPRNLAAMQAELQALEAQHDAAFEFSDSYTVWHRGREQQQRIRALRGLIKETQQ